jgi:hypothetical protein
LTSPLDDSWAEYHAEIDRRLDEVRPPRAGVGETDWREPVYGWARNHIPNEPDLVRRTAKRVVDLREGEATKRGNVFLRAYGHGQQMLDWAMLGALPIKVGEVRVRFDAATPEDLEDAARLLERNAKRQYDEEVLLVGVMRDIARDARRGGFAFVAQIGNLTPFDIGRDDEPFDDL